MYKILAISLMAISFFPTNGMMRRTHYDKRDKKKQPSTVTILDIKVVSKYADKIKARKQKLYTKEYKESLPKFYRLWEGGVKEQMRLAIKKKFMKEEQLSKDEFEKLKTSCPQEFYKLLECLRKDNFSMGVGVLSSNANRFDYTIIDQNLEKIRKEG